MYLSREVSGVSAGLIRNCQKLEMNISERNIEQLLSHMDYLALDPKQPLQEKWPQTG